MEILSSSRELREAKGGSPLKSSNNMTPAHHLGHLGDQNPRKLQVKLWAERQKFWGKHTKWFIRGNIFIYMWYTVMAQHLGIYNKHIYIYNEWLGLTFNDGHWISQWKRSFHLPENTAVFSIPRCQPARSGKQHGTAILVAHCLVGRCLLGCYTYPKLRIVMEISIRSR